jgi:hypothetical protein
VKRHFLTVIPSHPSRDRFDTQRRRHAFRFHLRNRTTAQTEYAWVVVLIICWNFEYVNSLSLRDTHRFKKSKILNYRALLQWKEKKLLPVGTPRLIDWPNTGRIMLPNSRISMESNCRPQLGSFELNQLKIWANFKYINSLLAKRQMIGYFWKNMSNIPGDNGSSLNKLITLKIIALTNITVTKTSVSVVYP